MFNFLFTNCAEMYSEMYTHCGIAVYYFLFGNEGNVEVNEDINEDVNVDEENNVDEEVDEETNVENNVENNVDEEVILDVNNYGEDCIIPLRTLSPSEDWIIDFDS